MLTDVERSMLEHEARWWRHGGAKDSAIVAEFGWSPVRYYMRLNRLLETPAALEASPVVVNRLLRARRGRRDVG